MNGRSVSFVMLGLLLTILSVLALNSTESVVSVDQHVSTTVALVEESPDSDVQEETLEGVIELARQILTQMNSEVDDYTATLVKRERISGTLGGESRMELKVRNRQYEDGKLVQGLSAYIKFLSPKLAAGREVIWEEGKNDNQIVCHEGGFKNWTRLTLDPEGRLAMMGNKYPITQIGLVRLVEKLIEKGERDQQLSETRVRILEDQKVGDRPCRMIEVKHPEFREGLEFHVAHIFLDRERMIPLRYAAYLWPEDGREDLPLEEEYTYLDVEVNVGLTDQDFDPDNEDYEYP